LFLPVLGPDEQRLLEASMAYVSGNPIMTDAEFDDLKLRLKVGSYHIYRNLEMNKHILATMLYPKNLLSFS
jgi:hypothetical protein